ncbi:MAG: 4Fe-4S binding protein [Candidatus Hermodarchaeia archaeon]|jgi:formate hydrogenlyase subunit 6/NADH:ubiquinone oxidoreductase subunit I
MVRELLKHLLKRPATLKYPFEKRALFKGLRGRPVWDMKRCTGCKLCYRDCPSGAIEMIGKGPEAEFKHHLDRCLFCGQCEEVCPVNAITMTEQYELTSYDRLGMIIEFKREEKASKKLSRSSKNL